MPDAVFSPRPKFAGNVSNRPVNGGTVGSQPKGPIGPPVPPPPPPPPPVPLTIVAIETSDVESTIIGWRFIFDGQPFGTGAPNWTFAAANVGPVSCFENSIPNSVTVLTGNTDDVEVIIPADSLGIRSATGGAVVAGTYPLPFPPP